MLAVRAASHTGVHDVQQLATLKFVRTSSTSYRGRPRNHVLHARDLKWSSGSQRCAIHASAAAAEAASDAQQVDEGQR